MATEEHSVSARLSRLRGQMVLTQEQAASRAGVTLRQWQRWEAGVSEPRASNLTRLSEEFQVPLSELVGQKPPAPEQMDALEERLDRIERHLEIIARLMGEDRPGTNGSKVVDAFQPLEQAVAQRQRSSRRR